MTDNTFSIWAGFGALTLIITGTSLLLFFIYEAVQVIAEMSQVVLYLA